jgi:hypothetical protein
MEITTHKDITFEDIFDAPFRKEIEKKLDDIAANLSDTKACGKTARQINIKIDFKPDLESVNKWVDTERTLGIKLAPVKSAGTNCVVVKEPGSPAKLKKEIFTQGELFKDAEDSDTQQEREVLAIETEGIEEDYEEAIY